MQCQIIVPCFNEAERLRIDTFTSFLAARQDCRFLFVNDGSRDETGRVLAKVADGRSASVISLPHNRGKAEAVRLGMLQALTDQPRYIGFWDADLSTPLDALDSFIQLLAQQPELEAVFGARVKLLGHAIHRSTTRHVLGRVFASVTSIILRLPVYDTQCGAKLFRVSPRFERVIARPFRSRWLFDVEILARYKCEHNSQHLERIIYEYPLTSWRDMPGSKVKRHDFVKAIWQLGGIAWAYRRTRSAPSC